MYSICSNFKNCIDHNCNCRRLIWIGYIPGWINSTVKYQRCSEREFMDAMNENNEIKNCGNRYTWKIFTDFQKDIIKAVYINIKVLKGC